MASPRPRGITVLYFVATDILWSILFWFIFLAFDRVGSELVTNQSLARSGLWSPSPLERRIRILTDPLFHWFASCLLRGKVMSLIHLTWLIRSWGCQIKVRPEPLKARGITGRSTEYRGCDRMASFSFNGLSLVRATLCCPFWNILIDFILVVNPLLLVFGVSRNLSETNGCLKGWSWYNDMSQNLQILKPVWLNLVCGGSTTCTPSSAASFALLLLFWSSSQRVLQERKDALIPTHITSTKTISHKNGDLDPSMRFTPGSMGQILYGRGIGTFGIGAGSRNMIHLPEISRKGRTMALKMRMVPPPTIIFETTTSSDIQFAPSINMHRGSAIYTSWRMAKFLLG